MDSAMGTETSPEAITTTPSRWQFGQYTEDADSTAVGAVARDENVSAAKREAAQCIPPG